MGGFITKLIEQEKKKRGSRNEPRR
jgi:hypothetical protein